MADELNGRVSLREYMTAVVSANDAANAERFRAIQDKLNAIARDQGDHEQRIRTLEKKSVWSNIADAFIGLGAIIAGIMGRVP